MRSPCYGHLKLIYLACVATNRYESVTLRFPLMTLMRQRLNHAHMNLMKHPSQRWLQPIDLTASVLPRTKQPSDVGNSKSAELTNSQFDQSLVQQNQPLKFALGK